MSKRRISNDIFIEKTYDHDWYHAGRSAHHEFYLRRGKKSRAIQNLENFNVIPQPAGAGGPADFPFFHVKKPAALQAAGF